MKIGILTLPLHNNYGGLIQAFALQKVLEKKGHSVYIINYPYRKRTLDIIIEILRNIKKNITLDKTFRAGEKVEDIFIEKRKMQYLYNDGDNSVFMDIETYEQESIPDEFIVDELKFLKEGQEVEVSFYEGEFISVELPTFVELKVTHTEPGLKGDTATTTFKPAMIETGASIQVPLFVNEGDVLKIDTRSSEYIERV